MKTNASSLPAGLNFDELVPVADRELGGLRRAHFTNSRLFAILAPHGGLIDIRFFGWQCYPGATFFSGALETAYHKVFRPYVRFGAGLPLERYALPLNHTQLFPFGTSSTATLRGEKFIHETLLLPDALVQRVESRGRQPVSFELVHNDDPSRCHRDGRVWSPFKFDRRANALIAAVTDRHAEPYRGGDSLAQQALPIVARDIPYAKTWLGLGCDVPFSCRHTLNHFKFYLQCEPTGAKQAAFYLVFAPSRAALRKRLATLSTAVHRECQTLKDEYFARLKSRPQIDIAGNKVLNSAFAQQIEGLQVLKVLDVPGASRAAAQAYTWGWDALTPCQAFQFGNEAAYTANIFHFLQKTLHPRVGIPHMFFLNFKPRLQAAFASQMQFAANLYSYVAVTGDLKTARAVWPTCLFLMRRSLRDRAGQCGLARGVSLWPDLPEWLDEDGQDLSALNNSLLYQGLRGMEYLGRALGEPATADQCADAAAKLRADFVNYLYDKKIGYFVLSCSAVDFKPRKHYPCEAIFWLTPFARELTAHAPARIADFMHRHLRADKCLLSLPQWDQSWMRDGNQLGSSFPSADYFYLQAGKLAGRGEMLRAWLGDVEWHWHYHTQPEAFTPEAANEADFGPDNTGQIHSQTSATWYAAVFYGAAGLDFDHEGLTVTPWSDVPVTIRGVNLRGTRTDITVRGRGNYLARLQLNGKTLPAGSRKIAWSQLTGRSARLEITRTDQAPQEPEILRADGLRVQLLRSGKGELVATINGDMHGEVVLHVPVSCQVRLNNEPVTVRPNDAAQSIIPYRRGERMQLTVSRRDNRHTPSTTKKIPC
ncbi:MAG: hypothetical protein LBK71_09385 [Verrucomicrobiales bacterium]|jgi:hypothetical protein|nr:hypothetical protein [Verrucomicrobiales bacterium]